MNRATVSAVRHRPRVVEQAGDPVHLLPLPVLDAGGPIGALCGTLLFPQQLETVEPGQGTPCLMCVRQQAATIQPAGPVACLVETAYRALNWPVHLRGDHVVLPLGHRATAQIMSVDLAEAITKILTTPDRPAPVLLHPDALGCAMVITGEPYGRPLPWPETVQVVTGMLALPPSRTPNGPVRWRNQAPTQPLTTWREIDIFAAVRIAEQAAHQP